MSEIYTDLLPQRKKKKKIKNMETYRVNDVNVAAYKVHEKPYYKKSDYVYFNNKNTTNNNNNLNNNNNKITRGSCDIFEFGCPCLAYSKKKKKLREQGAMVDKPADYDLYPGKYGSLRTHGWYDVKVYYKYGPKWVMHDDGKLYHYEY